MSSDPFIISYPNSNPIITNNINVLLFLLKFVSCLLAFTLITILFIRIKLEYDLNQDVLNRIVEV